MDISIEVGLFQDLSKILNRFIIHILNQRAQRTKIIIKFNQSYRKSGKTGKQANS